MSYNRVSKAEKRKKWSSKSKMNHQPLLVIKKTLETGYGLFAPGIWPKKSKRKVVISKGDVATGYAGFFASNKDRNTSKTHTAPAGNYGLADGKKIRDLVVENIHGLETHIIGSPRFNLASKKSGFHVSWDMLGVFLNSSYGSEEQANVTSPCQKEATAFHVASSDVEDRVRVSPRFKKDDILPDSFIMMPMYAIRDIYEGEQLLWCYPWRV